MTIELVYESKIIRESGWLYFINKEGNIMRSRAMRGGAKLTEKDKELLPKPELIAESKIIRETNYVYFINKEGNIMRAKMMRGRTIEQQKRLRGESE